jgi:hypothetical protein
VVQFELASHVLAGHSNKHSAPASNLSHRLLEDYLVTSRATLICFSVSLALLGQLQASMAASLAVQHRLEVLDREAQDLLARLDRAGAAWLQDQGNRALEQLYNDAKEAYNAGIVQLNERQRSLEAKLAGGPRPR